MSGIFIDTNLLVLLVVGNTDRKLITKHKRTLAFTEEDYELLVQMIEGYRQVFVTPNILTEASNLLAQHEDPERTQIMMRLRLLIHGSNEVVVASAQATSNRAFERLGLADTVLLEAITTDRPLVTTDLGLYVEAARGGQSIAFNFNHYRTHLSL